MTAKEADLEALQRHLQQLVDRRCEGFGVPPPAIPSLALRLPDESSKAWLPLPRMTGGFSYWAEERRGQPTITVESWSRVVEGSGQRHHVYVSGFV